MRFSQVCPLLSLSSETQTLKFCFKPHLLLHYEGSTFWHDQSEKLHYLCKTDQSFKNTGVPGTHGSLDPTSGILTFFPVTITRVRQRFWTRIGSPWMWVVVGSGKITGKIFLVTGCCVVAFPHLIKLARQLSWCLYSHFLAVKVEH